MKNQQPEKIDVEKNPLGINFLKSKKVKNILMKTLFFGLAKQHPDPLLETKQPFIQHLKEQWI